MRFMSVSVVLSVAAAAVLVAPEAQAACAGPVISATTRSDGALVVDGQGFGTECYDANEPPEGEGALGPPARDITVVVRESGGEWLVAQGGAEADYTFRVEVTDPPPITGTVRVEARYPRQVGFTSYYVASADVTLAGSESLTGGTQVMTFGQTSTDAAELSSGVGASSTTKPSSEIQTDGRSGYMATSIWALFVGLIVGSGVIALWNRRQNSADRP
jgi:hypothetical protein